MNEQDVKASVQETFGANAHKYVASESHAKGDDLSLMVEWMQPQTDWTALDIATGGGHVAKNLAPHVAHVTVTDLTRNMLAAARGFITEHADNVSFVVADAEQLPFLDGTFDIVTCRIAAHHFPNPSQFAKEAARVLKPHGKLLFIDNIAPEEPHLDTFMNTVEKLRDDSHFRCHTISEWTAWLEAEGLVHVQSRTRKKTQSYPTWVRRTTRSDEQIEQVTKYILDGTPEQHTYHELQVADGNIVSFSIDEWMVLFEKGADN
ncbi:class I SAM-dependent methyltransferase [Paenibacillus sp. 481]|uniref:class I SAM-dependent methyltransferase n=1 Tax=Paenibacillus sp. 481 TaxID=2835869 RepID=UPI003FA7758C